eukprot:SAG11_NODE_19142_length_473_cov_1.085561_2_plen_33_part_01
MNYIHYTRYESSSTYAIAYTPRSLHAAELNYTV